MVCAQNESIPLARARTVLRSSESDGMRLGSARHRVLQRGGALEPGGARLATRSGRIEHSFQRRSARGRSSRSAPGRAAPGKREARPEIAHDTEYVVSVQRSIRKHPELAGSGPWPSIRCRRSRPAVGAPPLRSGELGKSASQYRRMRSTNAEHTRQSRRES
jgi:hypothetical protein